LHRSFELQKEAVKPAVGEEKRGNGSLTIGANRKHLGLLAFSSGKRHTQNCQGFTEIAKVPWFALVDH
jgi:hypothetical protein